MNSLRGGVLHCCSHRLIIVTWNVEGLSNTKIVELERIMQDSGIHILCMQETHRARAYSFVTDGQSLVISSGR